MAGLVLLYLAQDKKRLNDIVFKYQSRQLLVADIIPEVEGYNIRKYRLVDINFIFLFNFFHTINVALKRSW